MVIISHNYILTNDQRICIIFQKNLSITEHPAFALETTSEVVWTNDNLLSKFMPRSTHESRNGKCCQHNK